MYNHLEQYDSIKYVFNLSGIHDFIKNINN